MITLLIVMKENYSCVPEVRYTVLTVVFAWLTCSSKAREQRLVAFAKVSRSLELSTDDNTVK